MWLGVGEPDRRADMFGGSGEVRVWSLLRGSLPPFDCVLGCELDAGGHVGEHVQDTCTEVVIVTDGHGEATVSGAAITLRPGIVVALPLGLALSLTNHSQTAPLRYLIVKARGSG